MKTGIQRRFGFEHTRLYSVQFILKQLKIYIYHLEVK